MAGAAIHRTTLEYRVSPSTADVPEPTWKHDPDMSAVAGVPFIYWKAPADWSPPGAGPVEMSPAEKAVKDTAIAQAAEDAEMGRLDLKDALSAFALVVLDELNQHAQTVTAILDAIDSGSNLGQVKASVALIADLQQRSAAQLKAAVRTKYQGL